MLRVLTQLDGLSVVSLAVFAAYLLFGLLA